MVILHTSFGPISIELDTINTPNTAANFLEYAENKFYDGTLFHRVINGFMIQGGGFVPGMTQKSAIKTVANEADKAQPNNRGTIAMARTSDPHSASAQFFINVADNHFLNHTAKTTNGWGYCVFGKVTAGMEVVDKIKAVATGTHAGHDDVPREDVLIERVEVTH